MKPFIVELNHVDPVRAFSAVQDMPYSLFFDSADQSHPHSRYSFIACQPIETIEAKNGFVRVTNWEQQTAFEGDPFELVKQRLAAWVPEAGNIYGLPPFQGGAAGFFGYDLARGIETLPSRARDNPAMPDMAVGIYDQVFSYDHLTGEARIVTHAASEGQARVKQEHLTRLLSGQVPVKPYEPFDVRWTANFEPPAYKKQVGRVIDYIRAGDIFQANLSQRFDADLPEGFDSYAHYLHLREVNPAPFAAYMNLGDIRIASASPERFLTVKDGSVETRPIKGTRPHVRDSAADAAHRDALRTSAKDQAENTMIVDLLRNDLSKVCTAESIHVAELCKLETFASVHHLVSTIHGRLKRGQTPVDLLRACFPGGSITGAPKIRAMEIIEALEPTRRGSYCGSMGYIGFDGMMDSNILIRTLVYEGSRVSLQAGGGIVADSDPAAEYQETLDKAEALLRSFEGETGVNESGTPLYNQVA